MTAIQRTTAPAGELSMKVIRNDRGVESALRGGAGHLLESVRLFDEYVGEQVGPGRRSLAYRLTLRAPDRTLTGEEADAARDQAVAAAAADTGAQLRSA